MVRKAKEDASLRNMWWATIATSSDTSKLSGTMTDLWPLVIDEEAKNIGKKVSKKQLSEFINRMR